MRERRIPFPQANDMEKLYRLLEYSFWNSEVTKYDVKRIFNINDRQGDYYLNALSFLGLLNKRRFSFCISELGTVIMKSPLSLRFSKYCEAVLKNEIVSFVYYLSHEAYSLESYSRIIADKITEKYSLPLSTATRRTNTIISWVKWINSGQMEIENTNRQNNI